MWRQKKSFDDKSKVKIDVYLFKFLDDTEKMVEVCFVMALFLKWPGLLIYPAAAKNQAIGHIFSPFSEPICL
jgi:hypothetical protein